VAKFLAIDWDEAECRYAAATLHNGKVAIRNAGVVSLDSEDDNGFDSPLDTLATALYARCKDERIGGCSLLISLGRNDVEWLQQKLPPSKESEIPMLLKNQILREVPGSNEADPVDYLMFESSFDGHRILALTIPLAFRKSLSRTFRSLGYPLAGIGFRAGNAVELVLQNLARLDGEPTEPRLVVNTVGSDVDLIIVVEKRIAAMRSFRLPAEDQQKSLADEIERTLTIGVEGSEPLHIQRVVLFGDGTKTELSDHLSESDLTVQFLNPLTLPNVSVSTQIEDPEKFAPLVGSLLLQSQKAKPVIDFLHPKAAPKPPNYTRPALMALVLLGVICFGLYYLNRTVLNDMEQELVGIKEEHQKVVAEYQKLVPNYNVLRQTVAWEMQNVVWLDILRDLSVVLPGDADLVVTQMTFTTGPPNNNPRLAGFSGSVSLSGMVRDPSVLMKLQQDLHASRQYMMQHPSLRPNPAEGGYPSIFNTVIYRVR
jgi:hypothetical protein